MLKECLKNKAVGSYLSLAAALVALVTAIIFLTTQETAAPLGHTGTLPGIVLLVGAAVSLILFFLPVRFGALIQTAIYSFAMYLMIGQLYFVFADVINKVTFAGGNAGLCVLYMAGAFVAVLLSVIACFFKSVKAEETVNVKKELTSGLAVAAAAVVCLGIVSNLGAAKGQGTTQGTADNSDAYGKEIEMKFADNKYTSASLEDLVAIATADWQAKETNGEVAYFFEGQYTEGFSTIVDPACLDMYCYKDGSMYGTFSGPITSVGGDAVSEVYGYWYNIDENGEENFVIHILGNRDQTGAVRPTNVEGGADADVFIFDTEHGVYNKEASLSYGVMGGRINRNINIYGQPYAPAQSLTLDASNCRTFYTGDMFSASDLAINVIRQNGAEENVWPGRLAYSGYDSDTVGTKKVTGRFLGQEVSFEVQVEQLVTDTYKGSYDLVKGKEVIPADASMLVDYSHKVVTVSAADGSASIKGTLNEVKEHSLVMSLNGSQPIEVTIAEENGVMTATVPAHDEVVAGWGSSTTYSIGEAKLILSGSVGK